MIMGFYQVGIFCLAMGVSIANNDESYFFITEGIAQLFVAFAFGINSLMK